MTDSSDDSFCSSDETLMNEDDLNKFTSALDEFKPAIPETVTNYYMRQCGVQTDDERVVKLLSASAQMFITDIINDCFQLHKIREKSTNKQTAVPTGNSQTTTATEAAATTTDQSTNPGTAKKPITSTNQTLTLNDLTHVLGEYGINVKKTYYYT